MAMADGSGEVRVAVRVVVMDGGMVVVERNHCGLLMAPNQVSAFADARNLAMKRAGSQLVCIASVIHLQQSLCGRTGRALVWNIGGDIPRS